MKRKWVVTLLTTLLFLLQSILIGVKGELTSSVGDSNQERTIQKSLDTNSEVPIILNEVRTDNLHVSTKNMESQYYTQSDINRKYVDSLVNASILSVSTYVTETVLEQLKAYELSTKQKDSIKAKAYLSIPISLFPLLILLWIGNRTSNKQLITVSLVLLISSIIGTFVVLPTIINGLCLL